MSPFLYTGQMLACFHSDGILPQLSDFLKIIKRIGEINSLHSLSSYWELYPVRLLCVVSDSFRFEIRVPFPRTLI